MKKKIAILTLIIIVFNSIFCYGDSDKNVFVSNNVFTDLKSEYEYDIKTDTYYFPINDVDVLQKEGSRSATVAVSGAVISSVLALAVKAGLEFSTSNSMSEFVSRFFMLDGISSVVSGMNDVVNKSVDGVLNFSRSLLDTIGSKFSELMSKNDVGSVYIMGRKFPLVYENASTTAMARYVFENTTLPKLKIDLTEVTATDENGIHDVYDTNILIPSSLGVGTFSVEFYRLSSRPYENISRANIKLSDDSYYRASDYNMYFDTSTFSRLNYTTYCVPYFYKIYDNKYTLGYVVAIYSNITGYLDTIQCRKVNSLFVYDSHVGNTSLLPTVSSSWSGVIPSEDSNSSDLNFSVPKNTNALVGKTSSDISSPTYEVWTPGSSVIVPTIDTGTSDVPADEVYPPIVDIPSTDTDTPTTTWDWLKALLQSILDLIKSISDWLTNFWDKLLEFIVSIFVPSDSYFTDKFSNIMSSLENKLPDIDISKLNALAVDEYKFDDIYATFFGIECLVVKGSIINNVVSWVKPIIQGLIGLFLLLYNYNQIYKLIRGGSLVSSSNIIGERLGKR